MKVKEIMTKDLKGLSPETNALEALNLLFKMQISGLPVISKDNKLLGMFTEKEVIAQILPSYMENVGDFVYQENPKAVSQKIVNFHNLSVEEIMRKEVMTIDEDTTLCEVAHLMITKKARRIPVLNQEKEIVGIISRGDIVKALFKEYA